MRKRPSDHFGPEGNMYANCCVFRFFKICQKCQKSDGVVPTFLSYSNRRRCGAATKKNCKKVLRCHLTPTYIIYSGINRINWSKNDQKGGVKSDPNLIKNEPSIRRRTTKYKTFFYFLQTFSFFLPFLHFFTEKSIL